MSKTVDRLRELSQELHLPVVESSTLAGIVGWYLQPIDALVVPNEDDAPSEEVYVRHVLHKMAHWCGMPTRAGTYPTGGDERAHLIEELVAEAAGQMLAMHLGISTPELVLESARYTKPLFLKAFPDMVGVKDRHALKAKLDQEVGPKAEARTRYMIDRIESLRGQEFQGPKIQVELGEGPGGGAGLNPLSMLGLRAERTKKEPQLN